MNTVEALPSSNTTVSAQSDAAGNQGSSIETLRDGTQAVIRPIHKQDIELERRFIETLSPRSRRFRFLSSINSPRETLLQQLTDINPDTDAAFVALITVDAEQREIGVARFSAQPDGKDCEFAVTVSDEWQNKGLGSLLMKRLIAVARARGIESMHSSDASDNDMMRNFAEHLHFDHRRDPEDATQVLYSVNLQTARE